MKDMSLILSIFLIFVVLGIFFTILMSPILTDQRSKEYFLENKENIVVNKANLVLQCTDLEYYVDATLRRLEGSDNTYQIIFWGDRDSWKWRFKLDKHFIVDVQYNEHKNKNVDLDVKILELLKEKL